MAFQAFKIRLVEHPDKYVPSNGPTHLMICDQAVQSTGYIINEREFFASSDRAKIWG